MLDMTQSSCRFAPRPSRNKRPETSLTSDKAAALAKPVNHRCTRPHTPVVVLGCAPVPRRADGSCGTSHVQKGQRGAWASEHSFARPGSPSLHAFEFGEATTNSTNAVQPRLAAQLRAYIFVIGVKMVVIASNTVFDAICSLRLGGNGWIL